MHNGFQYRFGYDTFRNVNNIKVADWNNSQSQTLMEKTFYPANGPLKTQTYGDGFKLRYGYNKDGQVTKVYKTPKNLTETLACENIYNKNGELVYLKDLENNLLTEYQYDFTGRVTGKDVKDAATGEGSGCLSQRVGYDDKDRVSSLVQRLKGGTAVKSTYLYGDASKGEEPGLIYGMSVDGTQKETLTYDPIGRIVKRTFLMENGNNWETEYTYVKGNASYQGASTLLVESVKDPDKILFYTYDAVGNITQIHEQAAASGQKELKVTYEYDSLGQLIRENNKWLNETIVYAYDSGGNMQSKEVYTYTTGTPSTKKNAQCATLTYGNYWKDQLTKFQYTNGAEQNIEYTDGGNPYLYRNLALTWKDGRKLSQVKNGETVIASYTYDQNGIRIKKTVGSNVTNFHTDGGKILVMEKDGKEVHFIYDQDGSLFSMKVVNGTTVTDYYYEKNLQGDVVGLIDSNGAKKVNYMYDSWGRPVNMTDESGTGAGSLNPFRYRGYFYDEETGWYYLKSRYYDPEVGRFINADTIDVLTVSLVTLTDKNLYAYCDNNPLVRKDQEGNIWLTAMVIGFGVGIAFQYVGDVISNKKEGKTGKDVFEIRSSGMDYLASGVGGAIAAIPGLNFVGTVAVGAAGNVLADGMKGNINNFEDAVESATWGAFANAVGYGVSKLVAKGIVNKVNNMTRTSQKTYINQKLYRGSQAMVNSNYHDFMLKNTKGKVAAVERAIGPLRSGIYSTLTSTMTGLFRR